MYFARNLILNIITGKNIEDNFYVQDDYDALKNMVSVSKLIEFIKKANISANEIRVVSNKKIVFEMLIINSLDKKQNEEVKIVTEVMKKQEPILANPNVTFVTRIEKEFNESKTLKPKERCNRCDG